MRKMTLAFAATLATTVAATLVATLAAGTSPADARGARIGFGFGCNGCFV